jgi:hypothetical protein
MISDWTPDQLKRCKELTKLVRKVAALKAADPGYAIPATHRLMQRYVNDAQRLAEPVKKKRPTPRPSYRSRRLWGIAFTPAMLAKASE